MQLKYNLIIKNCNINIFGLLKYVSAKTFTNIAS